MRELLSLILDKSSLTGALRDETLAALLEAFVIELLEIAAKNGQAPVSDLPSRRRIEEILEYVRERNGIGVTVSHLATHFHLSQRHLLRLFLGELGRTPQQVILDEKRRKIEEYVTGTSLSLYEIAALCGFSDEYAMNKFFKRYTKTTLSAFARIARKR